MEADLFAEMRLAAERGNGNLRFLPALMLGRRASGCPRGDGVAEDPAGAE
jgi:hypothetical protein